jgi:D-serine deaminase-like pyridoxal phosphate-dependent protein
MTQHPPPLTVPDEPLDWRVKGLLTGRSGQLARDALVGASVFDGPFSWPLLTLQASAVEHNVAALATFCAERGVELAPHVKTTMAPSLIGRQLAAGAWALTVATPYQLQVGAAARRPQAAARQRAGRRSRAALAGGRARRGRQLRVLLLRRLAGGRRCGGGRDGAQAVPRARRSRLHGRAGRGAATRTPSQRSRAPLRQRGWTVVGVGRIRGDAPGRACGARPAPPDACRRGHAAPSRPAVRRRAGDRVGPAAARGSTWSPASSPPGGPTGWPCGRCCAAGCYVGHDDGVYAATTPYAERIAASGSLRPALRLWAQLSSTPEPGLALVGFGKRDASFDAGFPVPLEVRGAGGVRRSAAGLEVVRLDDQHAYLTVAGAGVAVGEVVRFGISHPCTVFDRWSTIPLVDDEERVLDVLRTYF